VTIPKPKKTVYQYWPDAWHWLREGATITNEQLNAWALEPLPGENVALVGEAYFTQRSGWSDGAYKSSIKLLNAKYGMKLPGLTAATALQNVDSSKQSMAMKRAAERRLVRGGVSLR
jgi:hypothetical protein